MIQTAKYGLVIVAIAWVVAHGCATAGDRPADTTDGTSALPEVGDKIPSFAFRGTRGDGTEIISSKALRGTVALIALWAPGDSQGDKAMVEFDSLMTTYGRLPGMRYVLLMKAHRTGSEELPKRAWVYHADQTAYAAEMHLLFDKSPSDSANRIQYKLPSFLMIDAEGRITRKVQGLPFAVFKPILDSMRTVEAAALALADSALADSMRAPLASAFERMDPLTLTLPDSMVSFLWCSEEGAPDKVVVPATMRLLSLTGNSGALEARFEVVSVAHHDASICNDEDDDPVPMTPGVGIDTVDARLFGYDGRWGISGFDQSLMLMPLDFEKRKAQFEPSVAVAAIRARIDSIRAARK